MGRSWWAGDAIRSSAADRVWLALEPPCLIYWQGEKIEVLDRKEETTPDGPMLRFECLTPRGEESMIVQPGNLHHPPKCEWARSQTQPMPFDSHHKER